MICPNCTKLDTSIISSKIVKKSGKPSIIRKRHCLCGYEFETVEIEKRNFKKRKIDKRTQWANYRFKTYVDTRLHQIINDMNKLSSEFKLTSGNFAIVKEKGKLKLIFKLIKKNKIIREKIPLRPRTNTIDQILLLDEYWHTRHKIYKNLPPPSTDKNNINEIKIEKREYEKSIVNHLCKNPKYNNKNFMISCFNYSYLSKWVGKVFNNEVFWRHWQKIL